jgi:predicted secreted protein
MAMVDRGYLHYRTTNYGQSGIIDWKKEAVKQGETSASPYDDLI